MTDTDDALLRRVELWLLTATPYSAKLMNEVLTRLRASEQHAFTADRLRSEDANAHIQEQIQDAEVIKSLRAQVQTLTATVEERGRLIDTAVQFNAELGKILSAKAAESLVIAATRMRAEYETLQGSVNAQTIESYAKNISDKTAQLTALEAVVRQIAEYAQHKPSCASLSMAFVRDPFVGDIMQPTSRECTCGLDTLTQALSPRDAQP